MNKELHQIFSVPAILQQDCFPLAGRATLQVSSALSAEVTIPKNLIGMGGKLNPELHSEHLGDLAPALGLQRVFSLNA